MYTHGQRVKIDYESGPEFGKYIGFDDTTERHLVLIDGNNVPNAFRATSNLVLPLTEDDTVNDIVKTAKSVPSPKAKIKKAEKPREPLDHFQKCNCIGAVEGALGCTQARKFMTENPQVLTRAIEISVERHNDNRGDRIAAVWEQLKDENLLTGKVDNMRSRYARAIQLAQPAIVFQSKTLECWKPNL